MPLPLSYPDALSLAQATLQANLPSAAVGGDSFIANVLAAVAAVIDQASTAITATGYQFALGTATGSFLDALANQVGIYRLPGSVSTTDVVFTLTPGPAASVTIPPLQALLATNSVPPVYFTNTAAAVIPAPGTSGTPSSSTATPVASVVAAAAGNVTAGTILLVNYQLGAGVLTVTNAAGATGGTDAESDADLRARAQVATAIKYGDDDLTAAVLVVAGVWDCWINDTAAPALSDANPSGTVTASSTYTCYWCASDGTQPGAGSPNTGVALAVQDALIATQAAGLVATLAAFTVVNLTAISVDYRVPSSISSGYIQPLIQTAVVAYIQSLVHNQIPDAFNMGQYVQAAVGSILTGFALVSTTPAIGSASHSTIYRSTGVPSTVVTTTAF